MRQGTVFFCLGEPGRQTKEKALPVVLISLCKHSNVIEREKALACLSFEGGWEGDRIRKKINKEKTKKNVWALEYVEQESTSRK